MEHPIFVNSYRPFLSQYTWNSLSSTTLSVSMRPTSLLLSGLWVKQDPQRDITRMNNVNRLGILVADIIQIKALICS